MLSNIPTEKRQEIFKIHSKTRLRDQDYGIPSVHPWNIVIKDKPLTRKTQSKLNNEKGSFSR